MPKRQIMEEVQQQIEDSRHDELLKMLSEWGLPERYDRRDLIRILGLKQMTNIDNHSRMIHESVDETIDKIVELSDAYEAKTSSNDILVAHRFLSIEVGERPVILRFAGRTGKLKFLKNKEVLSNKMGYVNVKVFEDLTAETIDSSIC